MDAGRTSSIRCERKIRVLDPRGIKIRALSEMAFSKSLSGYVIGNPWDVCFLLSIICGLCFWLAGSLPGFIILGLLGWEVCVGMIPMLAHGWAWDKYYISHGEPLNAFLQLQNLETTTDKELL